MKANRRPMIRCHCEVCVADRRADCIWLGIFAFCVLAAAYIGFQILRAVVFPA
jgi:hypothetical protein